MARISEKEKLINKYPQLKDEIIEKWDNKTTWSKTYIDDTGTICKQWDNDVIITESFKYDVVKMDLESLIAEEQNKIINVKQKYRLSSGFPFQNNEHEVVNENSIKGIEQLYLHINNKKVFISIPLDLDINTINNATVIENDNDIYVDGYLALEKYNENS